jgi:hypothetical protein
MGCDGMRWDGIGWDRMGWDGMGCDGMGWDDSRRALTPAITPLSAVRVCSPLRNISPKMSVASLRR